MCELLERNKIYSKWKWIIKDKEPDHSRSYISTWKPHSFLCQEMEKGKNAHLKTKSGASNSIIPRLQNKPLPPKEFLYIIKNMVPLSPLGSRSTIQDHSDCQDPYKQERSKKYFYPIKMKIRRTITISHAPYL